MSAVPGSSPRRTVYKHLLQAEFLRIIREHTAPCIGYGRTVSAMDWLQLPLRIVDGTCGYGCPLDNSTTCSVYLIHNFVNELLSCWVPPEHIHVEYIEKMRATYLELEKNVAKLQPSYSYRVRHMDLNEHLGDFLSKQFTIMFCDPNRFSDLTALADFFGKLPSTTLMSLTCGCNVRANNLDIVGSIKAYPIDLRLSWFAFLWQLLGTSMPSPYRKSDTGGTDLVFVKLLRDAGHWFYLYRLPCKWSKEFIAAAHRVKPDYIEAEIVSSRDDIGSVFEFTKTMCFTKDECKLVQGLEPNDIPDCLRSYHASKSGLLSI